MFIPASGIEILGVPLSKSPCKPLVMGCTYALGRFLDSLQRGRTVLRTSFLKR